MKKTLTLAICILFFALITTGAYAAPIVLDEHDMIGYFQTGIPPTEVNQANWSNYLITGYNTLADPADLEPSYDGQTFTLDPGSNVPPPPLPAVVGGIKQEVGSPGFGQINDPYLYLVAQFGGGVGGPDLGVGVLFYLRGQTGELSAMDVFNPVNELGLSHITLFNPGATPVPEPGTLLLLGSGLFALGFAGRRWFRQ
jgi:hypothetical protein